MKPKVTMKAAQLMEMRLKIINNVVRCLRISATDKGNVKKDSCVKHNEPTRLAAESARLIEGYGDVFFQS